MTRLRKGNRRARNRILKQGGLYTLQRHQTGPSWADTGATPGEILSAFVKAFRWEPAMNREPRPLHAMFPPPPIDAWLAEPPPPVHLGMFNYRGDYVYPANSILGNTERVKITAEEMGHEPNYPNKDTDT